MDVDTPAIDPSQATQATTSSAQAASQSMQVSTEVPNSGDNTMDVDNTTSSAPGPSVTSGTEVATTETAGKQATSETAQHAVNGSIVHETSETQSQASTLPQTVNTADIFTIPPPPSDAASTDISMTDAPPLAPALLTIEEPNTAGPSTSQSQPLSLSSLANSSLSMSSPSSLPRIDRTGYIYDPMMMLHCPDGYTPTADSAHSGDNHPEEPMRIKRIFNRLSEHGLIKRMKKLEFGEVTFEQVMLIHSEGHWDKVQGTECETLQRNRANVSFK
jgi:hypothetical protein